MRVVCFYTDDNYKSEWLKLREDLIKYDLPYKVFEVKSAGSWQKNTQLKSRFLQSVLSIFDEPILYLDVDSRIVDKPILFENDLYCDIAAHIIDWSKHPKRKRNDMEFDSAVLYLRNNKRCKEIIDLWVDECDNNPTINDQKCLHKVITNNDCNFYNIPKEYCTIFDAMSDVRNPVIKQFQASRKYRKLVK